MRPKQVLLVMVATALMSVALFSAARKQLFPEAHAQVGQTIEERQVIALETIASEMGRVRRDGVKCR